jgi:MFS family permease
MALGMLMVGGSGNAFQTSLWRAGAGVGILANDPNQGAVYWLSFWRVLTGLGIGGLLSAITAITAEFSNLKRRHLCISMMAIGYPIGGIIGGEIARRILTHYDWRTIFYFGAAITTAFIPVFYFVVPESVHWLVRKQPLGALEKVNHSLKRLGHKIVSALPEISLDVRKKSFGDLFAPGLLSITMIITLAYFLQITTYYFILKWVPKVVVDMGFTASEGANMLKYANIGGALGGALLGLLTLRIDLKKLTIGTLALSAVFISILGRTPADLRYIAFFVALSGFFGNAGIVGMYALFPVAFPTHVRASGAGFTVGVGRGGAILSPIMVGLMFQWGLSLPTVAMVISIGALIAAGVLLFLKLENQQETH